MKSLVFLSVLSLCMFLISSVSLSQTAQAPNTGAVKLDTDEQKTFYALGLAVGKNLEAFRLTPEELALVKAGLTDAVTNAKPQVDITAYGAKVSELAGKRAAVEAEDEKKKGAE